MKHCIYKHTFPDGKVYVGQTFSGATDRRWRNGKGYRGMKIEQAIKKYGWENVRHEIIEDGIDEELVDEKERYYINLYDSVKNGYNTSLGGKNIKDPHFLHKENAIAMHAFKLCGYEGLEDYLTKIGVQGKPSDIDFKNINGAFVIFEGVYRDVKGEAFLQRYDNVDSKKYAAEILVYFSVRLPSACLEAKRIGETFEDALNEGKHLVKAYLCSFGGFREGLEIDERTQQILDEIMEQRWGWMQKKLNLGGTK